MNQGSNDLQISSKAGATNRPAKDLITYVTTLSVFTAKGKIAIGVRGRGHFKIRGKSPSFDSNNAKVSRESQREVHRNYITYHVLSTITAEHKTVGSDFKRQETLK